eukprot:2209577-Amphidinium_carterae.1
MISVVTAVVCSARRSSSRGQECCQGGSEEIGSGDFLTKKFANDYNKSVVNINGTEYAKRTMTSTNKS